jgi:hypothetical protein
MELNQRASKYEIFYGKKIGEKLVDQRIAGFSLLFEGNHYYVMRLMMFPHTWYYMTKNKDSRDHYTIFAKCLRNPGQVRFQDPVGQACLKNDLKTHLEVNFHILGPSLFMNLFPSMPAEKGTLINEV